MKTMERYASNSFYAPYQELALRVDWLTDCLYQAERRGGGVLEVDNIKAELSYLMEDLHSLENMATY